MATRAQLKAQAEAELLAQQATEEIVDAGQLSPVLAALRAKFGLTETDFDASVYVYLCDGDDAGNEYRVWETDDADTYNLKTIARKHGSGRYRLRVYATDSEGRKVLAINRVQGIRLTPEEDATVARAKEAAKNPQMQPANNDDMRGIMREMMGGFQSTLAAALASRPAQADPFEQMAKLASMMKTLAPAQPVAPAPDLLSLLGLLEKLKNITGGNTPADASATEMLLMKAADAFLPAVAQGLNKQNEEQPSPHYVQPAIAPLPAPSLDEEQEQMKLLEQMKLKMFSLQLMAANKAQARGVAPGVYAETIYDNFDEADIQAVATNPEWFSIMCQAVPDCAGRQAWYESVRAKLIEMALEDELLFRDAGGNLTLEADSGKTIEPTPEGAPNGPAIA
jgi:hypothetical protein